MEILKALFLGVIQGLTEFLPVSSSGHLEIGKAIFGENSLGKESMLLTVVLHFATALSTVLIFRKEIAQIFKGLFAFKRNEELMFSLKIIISMIPTAIVGLVFKDEIESLFVGDLIFVGFMLLLTGLLLLLADRAKKTKKEVSFSSSLIIGFSQAVAILPGISRSGATISSSVMLGVDREKAAKFSFLMVVPLIFGIMILDTKDYLENRKLEKTDVSKRSIKIVDELHQDGLLTDANKKKAYNAIFFKEKKWSDAKLNGNIEASLIELEYKTDLENAQISPEIIDQIIKHDFGMVRSIKGPNLIGLLIGFICAFITGLFACKWMIAFVKKAKLKYFSFYCFAVGIISISYSLING
ncbi:MAG: undecaprenyl-diphosphate phosphatase [Flavobacteriales bacterium]|nr:undecaprenyl-diphosphate phosphatase [Flavobacteriales bacterium]